MTYRRILKSAGQAFVIAGTFMLADVEEIHATGTRVYSDFQEFKNEALTGFDNQLEVLHQMQISGEQIFSENSPDRPDYDRARAEIEEARRAFEASDNLADLRQRCEPSWCGAIDNVTILNDINANTASNIEAQPWRDERINEIGVDRYEKQWTEDRQNDGINSWNSSEPQYEASREYNSKDFSQRIKLLEDKLNSGESPVLTGLKEAVPVSKIKVFGKLGKKMGGRYGENIEKTAESAEAGKGAAGNLKRGSTMIFGNDEKRREVIKELKKEGKIEAARALGSKIGGAIGGVLGGPPGAATGAAIGSALVAGGTAGRIAQKERNRKAESIRPLKEDNKNLALVEEADGNKEAKDTIVSVFGKNNEADGETPSEHNFLLTLRRNQAQKLKASIAAGSGPMTPHLDHMKKKLGQKINESLKEKEQERP